MEPRILLGLHSSRLLLVGWCCSLPRTSTYQGTSASIGTVVGRWVVFGFPVARLVGRRIVFGFAVARIGIFVSRLRCRAGFLLFCLCASRCPLLCRRVGPRIQFPCIEPLDTSYFPNSDVYAIPIYELFLSLVADS